MVGAVKILPHISVGSKCCITHTPHMQNQDAIQDSNFNASIGISDIPSLKTFIGIF